MSFISGLSLGGMRRLQRITHDLSIHYDPSDTKPLPYQVRSSSGVEDVRSYEEALWAAYQKVGWEPSDHRFNIEVHIDKRALVGRIIRHRFSGPRWFNYWPPSADELALVPTLLFDVRAHWGHTRAGPALAAFIEVPYVSDQRFFWYEIPVKQLFAGKRQFLHRVWERAPYARRITRQSTPSPFSLTETSAQEAIVAFDEFASTFLV